MTRHKENHMKTDTQLGADVAAELRWTFGERAPRIGVQVCDGVVALSGIVDDSGEKRAAADAVERVCGVRAINNVIGVSARWQNDRRP
jgi:osmotically-inducible protein OsmY